MFTGIVQDVGELLGAAPKGAGQRLAFRTALDVASFELGESVAVNGVCLTVAAAGSGTFEADVSPETLRRSTLDGLRPGAPVNLERALRPLDRLGGHFVLGHVDGVGRLLEASDAHGFRNLTVEAPADLLRYLVLKGSVAVDGISLTVSGISGRRFTIAVIPHTVERTNLAARKAGDDVNLEVDILGKYVERLLGGSGPASGVTMELLDKAGFLR